MATFPSKVNYATGDILTATNMNDVGGAINLLDGAQYAGAKNRVLNSNFSVWQRGTSIACSTTAYTADRWQGYRGVAGGTISRQATGDTTNLPNIQYCARVQRDAANTSTSNIYIAQTFESVNSIPLAGKTIYFSFYARKGANYSQASSQIPVSIYGAATTDQNVLTSMSGTLITTVTATLTTTWQRFTATATVASTYTQIGFYADFVPVGTAGAADYFEITGVQLEAANTASPYAPNGATYQAELAACQRYLPAMTGTSLGGNILDLLGFAYSTTGSQFFVPMPVTPRVRPTGITISALSDFTLYNSGFSSGTPTAIAFNSGGQQSSITVTTTAGSPTIAQNQPVKMTMTGANGFILFTGCEL
jgi:hypothetical protein